MIRCLDLGVFNDSMDDLSSLHIRAVSSPVNTQTNLISRQLPGFIESFLSVSS